MGGSISVTNDTNYAWQCKLGYDEKYLKVGSLVAGGVGTALLPLIFGAVYYPELIAMRNGIDSVPAAIDANMIQRSTLGNIQMIEVGANIVGYPFGNSNYAIGVLRTLEDGFLKRDFVTILPGKTHTWEKLKPYAIRQCLCVYAYTVDTVTVRIAKLYMHPLHGSGPLVIPKTYKVSAFMQIPNLLDYQDVNVLVQVNKTHDLHESTEGAGKVSVRVVGEDGVLGTTVHVNPEIIEEARQTAAPVANGKLRN